VNKILWPLSKILHNSRAARFPRPIVHVDNAASHRSTTTEKYYQCGQFRHTPLPPYSNDISSCNFFFFDDVKTGLKDEEFEMMEGNRGK
jgi:hypothetical protein